MRAWLDYKGWWSEADEKALQQRCENETQAAVEAADAMAQPGPDSQFEDVFESSNWMLDEQAERVINPGVGLKCTELCAMIDCCVLHLNLTPVYSYIMRVPTSQPADFVSGLQKLNRLLWHAVLSITMAVIPVASTLASGGLVLEGDVCIMHIGFYSAHFAAYQPSSSGNKQFCRKLPNTGATIFVLDYLHPSLKEVPVDFRIIRDVTGQGRFVKLKHIEAIENIGQHTLFYQPPVIQADGSLKLEVEFLEEGTYIGIVSAGHPSKDTIYTAVFPFEVGGINYSSGLFLIALLGAASAFLLYRNARRRQAHPRTGIS